MRSLLIATFFAASLLGEHHFSFNPGPGHPVAVVSGSPYSAEQTGQTIQTLADGTHIVRKSAPRLMYRDSQGRTRVEYSIISNPNPDPDVMVIEINDPVGGSR